MSEARVIAQGARLLNRARHHAPDDAREIAQASARGRALTHIYNDKQENRFSLGFKRANVYFLHLSRKKIKVKLLILLGYFFNLHLVHFFNCTWEKIL